MLEKLREVLFVVGLLKGKVSYYHLMKRLEEDDVIENKCKYCKYSMVDEKCEYYCCEGDMRIC